MERKLKNTGIKPIVMVAMEDFRRGSRIFRYCLAISFLIHFAIFLRFSHYNFFITQKKLKEIEITYLNLKLEAKKEEAAKKEVKNIEGMAKSPTMIVEKDKAKISNVKDMSKLPEKFEAVNKQPAAISQLQVKRKVFVPALKSEKIDNPHYQSYYETVRSMIKKRAYANYSKLDEGEAYLTFVVLSDGTLRQVQLIEEKTSANEYLRQVSLKSIQECNPFPLFPADLNYPELSFNVIISFELEE